MAYESQGAVLYFSSDAAASTTAEAHVGEVVDFTALTGAAAIIDVTHLQSTAKEKMIGLCDMGQITVNVNCVATQAGQVMCWTAMKNRAKRKLSIFLNDTGITQIDCDAYCMSMPITASVDGKITRSITFELSGLATFSTVAAIPVH